MGKATLNINDLMNFIESNKNIIFKSESEKNRMKNMLEKYSYSNIFSMKYLFATGRPSKMDNGIKTYSFEYKEKTRYKDLEKQYLKLLKLENKLRESVLIYETELKAHFVFFLEDFLHINNTDFKTFINALFNNSSKLNGAAFESEWQKQVKDYSSNTHNNYYDYYHLLIKILSFGTIGKILDEEYNGKKIFQLFKNYLKRKNIFFIGKVIEDLKTIIILRNSLCHKESIIIFLEKGFRKNLLKRKIKKSRDYLQERINAITKIYEYYTNKKLSDDSWIKKYKKYRAKNGSNKINFKKIKIYL
ncbi:hypothetical protein [Fusobacterium animalis]|jgi:hypothetical protein|uniref:hypothetical protein n=1 Tax=Fusobacterium animalis TaxID=76859 RepID=UPI003252FEB1